jgi:hypothetical protein
MLAGLPLMISGEAPGRPPGVNPRVVEGGRAAAGSKSTKCHWKELAMKHLIITAIVLVGLVAQSSVVSIDQQTSNNQVLAAAGPSPVSASQQLSAQEMQAAVGGENLSGCYSYSDLAGDNHFVCCLDLWFITICGGINVSAFERLLSF